MLTVVLTATGCLYCMDPSNVASTQGLEAVGALLELVILNISFVVLELVLIAVVGASQTKRYVRKAVTLTRKGSFMIRDSFSRVAPPLSTMKARPSGTLSDDSSDVSMRRGDSMQLFLNAPVFCCVFATVSHSVCE